MKKFYYRDSGLEITIGDLVRLETLSWMKVPDTRTYKIDHIHRDPFTIDCGTCSIIDAQTHDRGYFSMPIDNLIFLDREKKEVE